jgi:membrane fusion protein, multidrug efflux system
VNRFMAAARGIFRFSRTAVPLILGLAAVVLAIAWLSGFFETKVSPGQEPVALPTFAGGPTGTVGEVVKEYEEEALGTLKAADRTTVSSRIMARIDEILVSADDVVEQGQELVKLQEADLQARLKQAQETLTAATATQGEAKLVFDRIQRLAEQGAATQAELDAATAGLEVAKADVRRAEQAVIEATTTLSFAVISAPKSGRIVDRLAEPGDMAIPGEPLLTLYDPESLRLEVPVREDLAVKLEPGSKVMVHIDAVNRDIEGTVSQRVPQAEAASRSFLIKIELPAANGLFEGMFGRLRIPVGERRHLCLPISAMREIGQLQFVDVIRDDDTLERRFIKTGRRGIPGKIEVLSGVEAGERVVLYDGDHTSDALPTTSDDEERSQP